MPLQFCDNTPQGWLSLLQSWVAKFDALFWKGTIVSGTSPSPALLGNPSVDCLFKILQSSLPGPLRRGFFFA